MPSPDAQAGDARHAAEAGVTVRRLAPENFSDVRELARAFGATVCEPTWWPSDTGPISYRLLRSSRSVHYEIGSTRREGIPIITVGHLEVAVRGRSPRDRLAGEWSEPPALAHVRGLIGAVGVPPRLQAVIYDSGLQLQLIGYDTEQEIVRAVESLQRTAPPS